MSHGPEATGAPSPALVFETLFAYQRTAALRAAIELDLFRAIGEGPGDVGHARARAARPPSAAPASCATSSR